MKITRKMLKEYHSFKAYIEVEEEIIKQLKKDRSFYIDTMNCSPEYKSVKIIDESLIFNQNELKRITDEKTSVERWYQELQCDPIVKQAIKLRYLFGYQWKQIANQLTGGYVSPETISKQVLRFLNKQG